MVDPQINISGEKVTVVRTRDLTTATTILSTDTFSVDKAALLSTDPMQKVTFLMLSNAIKASSEIIINLSNADIMTGNSVPVEILPLPTSGYAWVIENVIASIKGTAGSPTPYTVRYVMHIITDTANNPQFSDSAILTSTVDRVSLVPVQANNGATDLQIIADKKVYFKIAVGDPTGGDAGNTLDLFIKYKEIDLSVTP
jgi:hypothetical protein